MIDQIIKPQLLKPLDIIFDICNDDIFNINLYVYNKFEDIINQIDIIYNNNILSELEATQYTKLVNIISNFRNTILTNNKESLSILQDVLDVFSLIKYNDDHDYLPDESLCDQIVVKLDRLNCSNDNALSIIRYYKHSFLEFSDTSRYYCMWKIFCIFNPLKKIIHNFKKVTLGYWYINPTKMFILTSINFDFNKLEEFYLGIITYVPYFKHSVSYRSRCNCGDIISFSDEGIIRGIIKKGFDPKDQTITNDNSLIYYSLNFNSSALTISDEVTVRYLKPSIFNTSEDVCIRMYMDCLNQCRILNPISTSNIMFILRHMFDNIKDFTLTIKDLSRSRSDMSNSNKTYKITYSNPLRNIFKEVNLIVS